jgi:RNA recognition motif-containing protein
MVKLFVGGFPLDISEIELVKLFNLHGDVTTIKIVRDKKTGTCKGYAFLEMKDQESADRAIEALDYTEIKGRMLTVKLVEPPAPSESQTRLTDSQETNPKYVRVEKPIGPIKKKRPRRQV